MLDLTVREWAAYCRGAAETADQRWREQVFGAWHSANFRRAKRLPSLRGVMARMMRDKPKPDVTFEPPSPERLFKQLVTFAKSMGAAPPKRKYGPKKQVQ